MPKEEPHLRELRKHRLAKRAKMETAKNNGPSAGAAGGAVTGTVAFQAVGNGALLLYTDHNRILFNCGEGTQRLATEQCPPRALAQLSSVFFTSRRWRRIGGLPGMCLTARAAGAPDVALRGPGGAGGGCPGLFESVRHFVQLQEFDVVAKEASEVYSDGTLEVESVPIGYTGPEVAPEALDKSWRSRNDDSEEEKSEHPFPTVDQTAMAYVVRIRGKPGRLLVERCTELGVPKGPLLGQLKAGQDVTLADGRTVSSAEVTAPASPDQTCLVVECPTQHHLADLVQSDKISSVLSSSSSSSSLPFVFHFTPEAVVQTKEYLAWMSKCGEGASHVMLNERSAEFPSRDILSYAARLRTLTPRLFPDLWEVNKVYLSSSFRIALFCYVLAFSSSSSGGHCDGFQSLQK